jgi:hypothetical protein
MAGMIQLLHNVHCQTTLNDPICHNEFTVRKDAELPADQEALDALLKTCYDTFKEKNTNGVGTVDANPSFWFSVFFQTFMKAKKESGDSLKISVPNGCCNTDQCPVKLFYSIIAEAL